MSFRHFLKRYLPHQDHIKKQGGVSLFSDHLHDPNLWHLHRRSTSLAAAIGIFCAFIPFPIQTVSSAALAIIFRVNLPVAVVFSLVSNPITIPPMFFFAYQLGTGILGLNEQKLEFAMSWEWISTTFVHIWQPLFLGCFILGTISSIITYYGVLLIWRITAVRKWENRKNNKKD